MIETIADRWVEGLAVAGSIASIVSLVLVLAGIATARLARASDEVEVVVAEPVDDLPGASGIGDDGVRSSAASANVLLPAPYRAQLPDIQRAQWADNVRARSIRALADRQKLLAYLLMLLAFILVLGALGIAEYRESLRGGFGVPSDGSETGEPDTPRALAPREPDSPAMSASEEASPPPISGDTGDGHGDGGDTGEGFSGRPRSASPGGESEGSGGDIIDGGSTGASDYVSQLDAGGDERGATPRSPPGIPPVGGAGDDGTNTSRRVADGSNTGGVVGDAASVGDVPAQGLDALQVIPTPELRPTRGRVSGGEGADPSSGQIVQRQIPAGRAFAGDSVFAAAALDPEFRQRLTDWAAEVAGQIAEIDRLFLENQGSIAPGSDLQAVPVAPSGDDLGGDGNGGGFDPGGSGNGGGLDQGGSGNDLRAAVPRGEGENREPTPIDFCPAIAALSASNLMDIAVDQGLICTQSQPGEPCSARPGSAYFADATGSLVSPVAADHQIRPYVTPGLCYAYTSVAQGREGSDCERRRGILIQRGQSDGGVVDVQVITFPGEPLGCPDA